MNAVLRSFASLLTAIAAQFYALNVSCNAGDLSPTSPSEASIEQSSRPSSILVFSGIMSTTSMYNTSLFNLNRNEIDGRYYDNYIFGFAYNRDIVNFDYGFHLGAEVGLADRLGSFRECCDVIVESDGLAQSGELWGGIQLRNDGILLFNQLRIGGAITFGLSAVTSSIGQERERETEASGNARLLYYLGPEFNFSTKGLPNFEFVVKLQHRSGGKKVPFLPTLGNLAEGYNANVVGIRYRF